MVIEGHTFNIDGITEERARFILQEEKKRERESLKYRWRNHIICIEQSEKEGFEELCGDFEKELRLLFQTLSKFPTEDEAILYLYKSINEPITAKQLADYKSNPNFERLLSGAFSMHFNNMVGEALLKRDDILMDLGYSPEEIEDLRNR